MTSKALLDALLPLVADLSREIDDRERYRRLLQTLRTLFPCDAAALLRLEGEVLVPLAIDGLSGDTLGRRFRVADHPRFGVLLANVAPTRFPADSSLPDPYDGLVDGLNDAHSGQLEVHDCMGCALTVNGRPWGLVTLDALGAGRFDRVDMASLQAFAALAAATVNVAERINDLSQAGEQARQRAEAYRLGLEESQGKRELIGQSPAQRQLMEEIRMAAPSDMTVLVSGETGTGKELVAHALHAASPRAHKPMISLNCAALPDTLVESELFGHVRGAFSGAVADRRGKFEMADGGTLFLDEVGELPLLVQAKLLRVLQSGQLQRVGSDREHRVDVRLIAATNRDLAEEVKRGNFRADFYHRLSVFPIRVPPLRERGRDVLLLAGYFLEQNRARLGLTSLRLSPDAQRALLDYPWPGNIRELEHLVGRSALRALAAQPQRPSILTLDAESLDLRTPLALATDASAAMGNAVTGVNPTGATSELLSLPLRDAVERYERELVGASLERHQGNLAAAARELGLDRANLSRLARRLGLR
ncbi:nitric oxide reductase transcriptional regulator NorR [Herbaspirillum sp. AP02]|uniref:nitric oxide reductase transcriptional regulator NorR n=1 Tax=unclassified Herbaspirillum TaxID=2624150 RepID=UPI0015DB3912|nr:MULTISPECIES: nitric oxide reductase transcriptional regulator NorR [unclassified Herbaspirillum]MBG7617915.1 nitric oxide reductase transcriptional regulator NorR [Herbaspirillum sp. AP02]NZD70102.1 nitric oxide reductase transcriptional regulator NorR [Herbaspirillum sp. AP21]